MTEPSLSFAARLGLAFAAFFRILGDGVFAARVAGARAPALPKPSEPAVKPPESKVHAADERAALQVLALLQREGRFIDFLEEDVATFSDAEIGAAARVVHAGCKKALAESFTLEPVRGEAEGARVTIAAGFDATAIRLTGHVGGSAPYTGTVRHRGYRASAVRLPRLHDEHDARVIAPAEVEL